MPAAGVGKSARAPSNSRSVACTSASTSPQNSARPVVSAASSTSVTLRASITVRVSPRLGAVPEAKRSRPNRISGTVFDWAAERPAPRALIQAVTPDSVLYLAQSDSSGRFTIGPVPDGSYLVRAILDANNNRAQDRSEAFDTVRVAAPQASPLELLAIVRDTLPPRIASVAPTDSVSLRVTFERP